MNERRVFEGELVTVERRRGLFLAQIMVTIVLCVVVGWEIGAISHPFPAAHFGWIVALLSMLNAVLTIANSSRHWPSRRRRRVRADASGVSLDGRLQIRRPSIQSAYLTPGSPHRVCLVRRSGNRLEFAVASDESARELLDALDAGPVASVASFVGFWGGVWGLTVGLGSGLIAVFVLGLMVGMGDLASLVALPLVGLVAIALARARVRVDVGTDGLYFARLGSKEFLAYGDIAGIDADGDARVAVRRRNGTTVRVAFPTGGVRDLADRTRDAFLERVEEVRRARGLREARDLAPMFAPDGKSARQWVDSVRGLVAEAGYRHSAWRPDELWRIVEDAQTDAASRAGAAIALAPSLDAQGRGRLRLVARASASPRLRVALEAVASPDEQEDHLEDVLEPLARSR